MTARRRVKEPETVAAVSNEAENSSVAKSDRALMLKEKKHRHADAELEKRKANSLREMHFAPMALVISIMICSGVMWVMAFRDVFATGSSILGPIDDAMQHFTKSTDFFEESKGWKSQQGGLSTVKSATTDDNNMGGLFVRKMAGAASLAVHSQKIVPFIFQPDGAHWARGHFIPVLFASALGNVAIAGFYTIYAEDLKGAGAGQMSMVICSLLLVEAIIMLGYAISASRGKEKCGGNVKLPAGKTPNSVPSRIVARTVTIASGAIAFIAIRDLFFPGQIITLIPRDDVYLEWTNAFFHSPPPGTAEAEENGLEAPLYVGDKFISQLLAMHLLISCFHKFTSVFLIRTGKDGSGEIKSKNFWKSQALGDGLLLFILRLFTSAAKSASLDIRWHLMMLGYETFILALYGFV
mmetsp:Transcript_43453/g.132194  ORF Transcript_43453/g.132194 Transcript_43453/m.132194 type:complete len:410 (-) Transcript_43453:634-1863(-)